MCLSSLKIPRFITPSRDSKRALCSQLLTNPSTAVNVGVINVTKREILLKKISTYSFAMLDLQIFLDTHPNDEKTLMKIRKYKAVLMPLVEEYEKEYGPLMKSQDTTNWSWVNSPWPWESEEYD